MKKILSVLCVLALIASIACLSVSAAGAPSFALTAEPVVEGATEVVVSLTATLPEDGNLAQAGFYVGWDSALTLKGSACVAGGMWQPGPDTMNPNPLMWVLGTSSLKAGETSVIGTYTFELPADAAVGSTYELTLAIDEENLPGSTEDETFEQVEVAGLTIEVVAAPVESEPVASEPVESEPAASEPVADDEPVASEPVADDEPVASEPAASEPAASEPAASEPATDAPVADTQPAPPTGDNTTMMFVVVAVMVVALGAAVVVKKVNVK